MSTRKVVLCADDYAMSAGVSRAILELAELGRVSATGAMTNMPGWPALAGDLAPFRGRIGLGLHLNLTWGTPLGPMPRFAPDGRLPSLAALISRSLSGMLPDAEIEAEIGRQVDAFAAATGREPDFVDGHQHVHALPGIRDALLRRSAADPAPGPGSAIPGSARRRSWRGAAISEKRWWWRGCRWARARRAAAPAMS